MWVRWLLMEAMNARERSDYSHAVAEEMHAERTRQRLTQQQVADAAGMSRITYTRLELGQRVADVTQLARVADALGLQMSELIARAEQEMKRT